MKTLWIIILVTVLGLVQILNVTYFQESSGEEITSRIDSINGSEIELKLKFNRTDNSLTNRIINCSVHTFDFIERNFEPFPFKNLSISVYPETEAIDRVNRSNEIIVQVGLFNPIELHQPEFEIARQILKLYLEDMNSADSVLIDGMSHYLALKIVHKFYPPKLSSFRFIEHYPLFGFLHLSFHDIPIIYSLGDIEITPGSEYAAQYYPVKNFGSVSNVPSKSSVESIYIANSVSKPVLSLLTIENYIGEEEVYRLIQKGSLINDIIHPDSLNAILPEKVKAMLQDVWTEPEFVDYKIRSINQTGDLSYQIFVERAGDATHPIDIALYTEHDTTFLHWNGKTKYKVFDITTESELTASTIDPYRQNLLDINFANNSYTIDPQYWGSLSLAIRSFFWFQNALMILGSVS